MPKKGDRRENDGKKEVWHHEFGWVDLERLGWDIPPQCRNDLWSDDDEAQAQLDMDNAEVTL